MRAVHQKVTASHLSRDAYLYVRQSSLRQVFEHTEGTRRQYVLRERAVALGWPTERVVVIDSDLGLSGADGDREGFKRLVAEVSMDRAGIVLGLEVSRLARNSADWHRLLEICALSETLILDEDGVYDPVDFNDRLLLGLKGTMSEAELHMMRARLRGGSLSAARRGELKVQLPVGLVYDPLGQVVLDPDAQVQHSLRLLFDTFTRTGSAQATVRHFNNEKLRFPYRPRRGPHKGELHWKALKFSQALRVLHNPRYAGAFAYGRSRKRRRPGGGFETRSIPREEWTVLLHDAHPGYITWERFEENERQLRDNAQSYEAKRRSPPREGPALLQGLAVCGVCGRSMTVRYHTRKGRQKPDYVCQREGIETASAECQRVARSALRGTESGFAIRPCRSRPIESFEFPPASRRARAFPVRALRLKPKRRQYRLDRGDPRAVGRNRARRIAGPEASAFRSVTSGIGNSGSLYRSGHRMGLHQDANPRVSLAAADLATRT